MAAASSSRPDLCAHSAALNNCAQKLIAVSPTIQINAETLLAVTLLLLTLEKKRTPEISPARRLSDFTS